MTVAPTKNNSLWVLAADLREQVAHKQELINIQQEGVQRQLELVRIVEEAAQQFDLHYGRWFNSSGQPPEGLL